MTTDDRWLHWLHAAKERAYAMEQLAPYARKPRKLKPLTASNPDWLESAKFPIQDPPNIISGTRWFTVVKPFGLLERKAA